jgi:hypothetical protein
VPVAAAVFAFEMLAGYLARVCGRSSGQMARISPVTATLALCCCCPAAGRDNDGPAMLFPQHQMTNVAVRDPRAGSNKGPTMR